MDLRSRPQPDRFFDGGTDKTAYDLDRQPRILLERIDPRPDDGSDFDRFRMRRRLGYRDEHYGPILVPNDYDHFPTDLTSVPNLLTWLVPKTGRHLPAALIHDGLISGNPAIQDYVSVEGHVIDRAEADRIFRNAMRDSGTGVIRRWLIWSAVTVAAIADGVDGWSGAARWSYRIAAFGSLLAIAVIGGVATLDLADVIDVLPWMGARPLAWELVGGCAAAVVIPILLGLTWGRFRAAGMILGVAAALLIHVTVVIAVLSLMYQLAERAAARWPVVVAGVLAVLVAACLVVTVALVLG